MRLTFGRKCWREEKREDVLFSSYVSFHPCLLKSWCAVRGRKTSKLICYPPFRHLNNVSFFSFFLLSLRAWTLKQFHRPVWRYWIVRLMAGFSLAREKNSSFNVWSRTPNLRLTLSGSNVTWKSDLVSVIIFLSFFFIHSSYVCLLIIIPFFQGKKRT